MPRVWVEPTAASTGAPDRARAWLSGARRPIGTQPSVSPELMRTHCLSRDTSEYFRHSPRSRKLDTW